jgi:hypothetical protein
MAKRRRRWFRGRWRRAGKKRVGSAIVFALTVLTPIMLASGTVLSSLHAYADEVDRRINSVTTQLVAASGAHEALARLAADLDFRGALEVQLNGGRSAVEVTQINGADTLDVADDILQVRSEGWLNGPADGEVGLPRDGVRWYRSVVTTTVKPRMVRFPVDQTAYVADPSATVYVAGTKFRINGVDGAGRPRLAARGARAAGRPARGGQPDPQRAQAVRERRRRRPRHDVERRQDGGRRHPELDRALLKPTATVHWTPGYQRLDDYTLGSDLHPAIGFADGNLDIRGNVVGRGALVVQGDLRVSGNLDFAGIILVGGARDVPGRGRPHHAPSRRAARRRQRLEPRPRAAGRRPAPVRLLRARVAGRRVRRRRRGGHVGPRPRRGARRTREASHEPADPRRPRSSRRSSRSRSSRCSSARSPTRRASRCR